MIDHTNSISSVNLLKAMGITKRLMENMNRSKEELQAEIEKHRDALEKLLEYLILGLDNPNLDLSLLEFLCRLLGIHTSKLRKKREELEHEHEHEMTEEERKNYMKWIIYEAYKIINPNRIAGETDLENFISNITTRGIEEARKYTSHSEKYEQELGAGVIANLDKGKLGFVEMLKEQGFQGHGRGFA